ncbi:FecR family protein [Parapedobacter tibetensis]|uniref:FecR family protein n=1 Tax=Parapedobacter tibetensis TaxID=2972951 RepID=UPI00214DE671|nr:FecR family protein [Parapedobacter tibetensis]
MEIDQRIIYLHRRYLTDSLSTSEAREWERILSDPNCEGKIKAIMQSTWAAIDTKNQEELPTEKAGTIFRDITHSPSVKSRFPWLRVAAVFVALLTIGYFFLDNKTDNDHQAAIQSDVLPGGPKAMLTLTDGRMINLSSSHEGIVVGDDITYVDGTFVISPESDTRIPDSRLVTLSTPKGGTYKITLADGTNVWLNSASTLRYPSRFNGNERVVELEGEAYFEVAAQAKKANNLRISESADSPSVPFRVVSKGQHVEVLGTQFNIAAYPDEPNTKTTLVEGSVRVTPLSDHPLPNTILKPGQQSVSSTKRLDVIDVDPQTELAWRNGRFNFDGKDLRQVMGELERWYDIEVHYEGRIPAIEFFGGVHRNNNLSTVMHILETNGIRYRLENGQKLTILSHIETNRKED